MSRQDHNCLISSYVDKKIEVHKFIDSYILLSFFRHERQDAQNKYRRCA